MTYEFSEQIRAFLQEKKYLENVSNHTIVLYETSFKKFYNAINSLEDIKKRVVELREAGKDNPVSVNTYLRHIKCFYLWQGKEWKLPWLKEEAKLIQTLSADSVSTLLRHKPKGRNLTRAHLVALTILDTGLRASEVLGLTKEDIDLDSLVFRVRGKGGKHRLVPFSSELRKSLFRYIQRQVVIQPRFLFGTNNNTTVSVRNLERDFKVLGQKCGITGRFHPHGLRHFFAINYLRNGGDLFTLSRILGHSSISTTQIYLRSMGIDQIKETHAKFSPLCQMHRSIR